MPIMTTIIVFSGLTATRATTGFIGKPLFSIKILLTGSESKFLIAILTNFNVPLDYFVDTKTTEEDRLQNILARLGARHLQENPNVLATDRIKAGRAASQFAGLTFCRYGLAQKY